MASAAGAFKGRDEYRKAQELEEARKAGLAPAAIDEDGKEINPHIPQFMAAAPWYLQANGPSLKHQKNWKAGDASSGNWYDRGTKGHQANKYRKGACENCGAMTHKVKDCVERPRQKGAKLTGRDIAADEKIQDFEMNWEVKHDRYNGYDAAEYSKVVERYEAVEALKTEKKKEKALARLVKLQQKAKRREAGEAVSDDSEESEEDEDDDKLQDKNAGDFQDVKRRVRTAGGGASITVRNLRIREDTAKYLRNLDVDSAHYDPKTRSMREDPTPNADPEKRTFRGDNFYRKTGDTEEFERMNSYAWDALGRGQEISLQAGPSQAEKLHKEFQTKKEVLTGQKKKDILERYGNASTDVPEELLLGQTEAYQEYDRAGRLVKGTERAVPRSKYEEDVFSNNHTTVWGSFWQGGALAGKWGYSCCHSFVRNAYCTGQRGIEAARDAEDLMRHNLETKAANKEADDEKRAEEFKKAQEKKRAQWGTDVAPDLEIDETKLKDALQKEEERLARGSDQDKKRGYNVTYTDDVTEEEMEAFRMKRAKGDDPLNQPGAGTTGYDYV